MAVSYADNAVMAKAHAMYGKRLTKENYNDMLNCKSLVELGNYLKTRTYYRSDFDALPTNIDSAQIEEILKMSLLKKSEKLCEYQLSAGENFYRYFVVQNDIRQLMTIIQLLIIGKPEKYLSSLPPFFNSKTDIDLYELAKVRSYSDLLKALEHTDYKKILERYRDNYSDDGMFILIENDLNKYRFSFLVKSIKLSKDRRKKKEIYETVNYRLDMYMLTRAYRLLNFGSPNKMFIRDFSVPGCTNFTEKDLTAISEAKNATDIVNIIPNTYYKKDFSKVDFKYIENATREMLIGQQLKGFRYYTNPTAVMLCYLFLAENEVRNIIHIVEAIKYNIPADKARSVLIGADS